MRQNHIPTNSDISSDFGHFVLKISGNLKIMVCYKIFFKKLGDIPAEFWTAGHIPPPAATPMVLPHIQNASPLRTGPPSRQKTHPTSVTSSHNLHGLLPIPTVSPATPAAFPRSKEIPGWRALRAPARLAVSDPGGEATHLSPVRSGAPQSGGHGSLCRPFTPLAAACRHTLHSINSACRRPNSPSEHDVVTLTPNHPVTPPTAAATEQGRWRLAGARREEPQTRRRRHRTRRTVEQIQLSRGYNCSHNPRGNGIGGELVLADEYSWVQRTVFTVHTKVRPIWSSNS